MAMFAFLRKKGLVGRTDVHREAVAALSAVAVHDIAQECVRLTSLDSERCSAATHKHYASGELAGDRYPCEEINCRTKRVQRLARFAALYSDGVYVGNYLSRYVDPDCVHVRDLQYSLYEDLHILMQLEPLITAGLVTLVSPDVERCWRCASRRELGSEALRRADRARRWLVGRFRRGLDFTYEKVDDVYRLACRGPKSLLDHGSQLLSYGAPYDAVLRRPRILAKVERGEKILLSRSIAAEEKLCEAFADDLVERLVTSVAYAHALRSSIVTELAPHIYAMEHLRILTPLVQRNSAVAKHLTAIVPFAQDVPVRRLIKLRDRESCSFLQFRKTLNRAIKEVAERKGRLSGHDAEQLYGDVLAPALAKLTQSVAVAERDLVIKVATNACALVGTIAFGFHGGFAGVDPIGIASALGIGTFAANLVSNMADMFCTDSRVAEHELYFLWKVQKVARR